MTVDASDAKDFEKRLLKEGLHDLGSVVSAIWSHGHENVTQRLLDQGSTSELTSGWRGGSSLAP